MKKINKKIGETPLVAPHKILNYEVIILRFRDIKKLKIIML